VKAKKISLFFFKVLSKAFLLTGGEKFHSIFLSYLERVACGFTGMNGMRPPNKNLSSGNSNSLHSFTERKCICVTVSDVTTGYTEQ
jgi:hypothetical protein